MIITIKKVKRNLQNQKVNLYKLKSAAICDNYQKLLFERFHQKTYLKNLEISGKIWNLLFLIALEILVVMQVNYIVERLADETPMSRE